MQYHKVIRAFYIFLVFLFTICSVSSSYLYEKPQSENVAYNGIMNVQMEKGNTFNKETVLFVIKNEILYCQLPRIGRMPGTIIIELPISISASGNLHSKAGIVAGYMEMPLGLKFILKLTELKNARIDGENIFFNLDYCCPVKLVIA